MSTPIGHSAATIWRNLQLGSLLGHDGSNRGTAPRFDDGGFVRRFNNLGHLRLRRGGSQRRAAGGSFPVGFYFRASIRLAEALSRDLATMAIAFVVQTTTDVHEMHTFMNGMCVRRLGYSRDEGGWTDVDGEPQSWERAYFFDEGSTADGDSWPDMLSDELTDDDTKRYEAAKRAGDAISVLSLLHPSSTAPMLRVCDSLGIKGDQPAGRWKKRSFWARLFGRG